MPRRTYHIVMPVTCSRPKRADFYGAIESVSPGGIRFKSNADVTVDEVLTCRIHDVGVVDVRIVSTEPAAFLGTVVGPRATTEAIVLKLVLKSQEQVAALQQDQSQQRVIPARPDTTVTLANGEQVPGRILTLSTRSASIMVDRPGRAGDLILIGETPASIVRLYEGSCGVMFVSPLDPAKVNESVVL